MTYHNFDVSIIRPTLEKLGYKLIDFGNQWRTSAVFRGGANKTSISIYKNSGVWTDYSVSGSKRFPFQKLIELTVKDKNQVSKILKSSDHTDEFIYRKKVYIEMDEVYPETMLQKLFPNYSFYHKKNISEEVLKRYKTGLASAGKMYRRMVFPIYNEHKQIIGFSGRKIDDGNDAVPKWKHIGKKKNWVYPAFLPNGETIDSIIREKEEVILVESIGDSMALTEQGLSNNLVKFGLDCSPALVSYLSSMSLSKVIIAANNDLGVPINHGLNGAIKTLMILRKYLDFDILEIRTAPNKLNDFSLAHEKGEDLKAWYNKEYDRGIYLKSLSDYLSNNKQHFDSKEVGALLNLIESCLNQ